MRFILIKLILIFLVISIHTHAQQTITGTLPHHANQEIELKGFEGFNTYTIDRAQVSEEGKFELAYSKDYYGMGYLAAKDNKPFFVILSREGIKLKGESLSSAKTIEIQQGKQNQIFGQYASEHPRREQALSAWGYLQKIYTSDSLFAKQAQIQQSIENEMQRIKQEDEEFLNGLDTHTYVSWYLPVRKLISSVATVAQYRTELIPSTIAAFRTLDYSDERLYKSGMLKDAIESHYWLLENMGQPLDTVFKEMNVSTDSLLAHLQDKNKKFNEITESLFNLLEKRSLFPSSEYLALKVLTQNSCTVNDDLAKQLESYRKMKKGNTAPGISFSGDVLKDGKTIKSPKKLSGLQAKYKVIIFGASWCPNCKEELNKLSALYDKWQSNDVEVIFVSLDTEKEAFHEFAAKFPFISFCDYKKWGAQAVKDYYVFATPTLFLLDKDHKIILRPNSINHMDAWVDYYLEGRR